jgi:type VI secretion system protein ImpE
MGPAETTAADHLRAGRLDAAIQAQMDTVRARPTDADARYLLCGLLAFGGDWQRAARQLDALGLNDPALQQRTGVYHNLLASEVERGAVLAGTAHPLTPPQPPEHVTQRLAAVAAAAAGDGDGTVRAVDAAISAQPELSGRFNEREFRALRDLDDLLGSVLEVFAGGRYLWLPLEHLRRLTVEPPQHLLDTIWLPAELEDAEGPTATVHLPVLYAGSGTSDSDTIRLGRETHWAEVAPDLFSGRGQRVLAHAADGEPQEVPLLELRTLEITGA